MTGRAKPPTSPIPLPPHQPPREPRYLRLNINPGYYRFDLFSNVIYPCPTLDCVGCNISCLLDSQCSKGSGGPLCSLCAPQYYLREVDEGAEDGKKGETCAPCTVSNAWLAPLLFLSIVTVTCGVVYILRER